MRLSLIATALVCLASTASAQVHVNGYMRKDGTYVQGYTRSSPDTSRANNWGPSGGSGYSYGGFGRDNDHDGISNRYDTDDDNDGTSDNFDRSQYGGR